MPPAAPSSAVPPSHNSLEPLDPNQPALPRQPNPHSNCGTPAGPISAVSSLGGFRTPAAERAAPSLKRPASETLTHEPPFWLVRRMSAHPLTAAEKRTCSNRCLGPTTEVADLIRSPRRRGQAALTNRDVCALSTPTRWACQCLDDTNSEAQRRIGADDASLMRVS